MEDICFHLLVCVCVCVNNQRNIDDFRMSVQHKHTHAHRHPNIINQSIRSFFFCVSNILNGFKWEPTHLSYLKDPTVYYLYTLSNRFSFRLLKCLFLENRFWIFREYAHISGWEIALKQRTHEEISENGILSISIEWKTKTKDFMSLMTNTLIKYEFNETDNKIFIRPVYILYCMDNVRLYKVEIYRLCWLGLSENVKINWFGWNWSNIHTKHT